MIDQTLKLPTHTRIHGSYNVVTCIGLLIKGHKDEHVIKFFFNMRFLFSLSEFGEVDPDKLKAAVKTFIHSCAGYSVATYVVYYMKT